MESVQVAGLFKALGDATRLRMFEYICCCCRCEEGVEGKEPTVGEICQEVLGVSQANSTASFHLKELRQAGLIQMEKRGKTVCCCPRPEALQVIQSFISRPGLTELQIKRAQSKESDPMENPK